MTKNKEWDFFGLPRPEYAASIEMLISSMAWSLTETKRPPETIGNVESSGIVYKKAEGNRHKNPAIVSTAPKRGSESWEELVKALEDEFSIGDRYSLNRAASIVVNSLNGNVAAKSQSIPVIPFNLQTALMQDSRGVSAKKNPPNYPKIFERLYALGGGEGSVAASLFRSYEEISGKSSFKWFDSVSKTLAPEEIRAVAETLVLDTGSPIDPNKLPAWLVNVPTPYHWFSQSWDNLANGNWKFSMPRKRWVDWVGCILRTALGAGYLYEMNFYYQLLLALSELDGNEEEAIRRILYFPNRILVWDDSQSISGRDISGKIRKVCERGTASRKVLGDFVDEFGDSFPVPSDYLDTQSGLGDWLSEARSWLAENKNKSIENKIRLAISGNSNKSADNVYETIVYSLLNRGGQGKYGDMYSLLRRCGTRYTVVEPGLEWFVVISSLQAEGPGGGCRVADVLEALEFLGIKTGYTSVVNELEKVGLTRTSHDADDAIIVEAAF